ncbi:MAG: preprotein translocase subunit SecE [Anaerolineae bacterium]|jgi:preprotein translocase subunit SecE|nr:preprotein translocase subunit SecE [Anaerolineae bacterium]
MASDTPRQGRRRPAIKPGAEAEAAPQDSTSLATTGKGRATPGRRQIEAEESAPKGLFGRLGEYFQGVRAELNKVTWPTREQVVVLFRNVLLVTIASAIVLGAIAFAFSQLFAVGLAQPIVFVVFGAVVAGLTFFILSRRRTQLQ